MNTFFITYNHPIDKYNNTTKIIQQISQLNIKIINSYIGNTIDILIIETPDNMMYLRLQLSNFISIKECHLVTVNQDNIIKTN